jgi:hypothetical protein
MATDHEDATLQKNAVSSKADPEQETSRDARVLVGDSRLPTRFQYQFRADDEPLRKTWATNQ